MADSGFQNLAMGAGTKGADGVNLAKTILRMQLCYRLMIWFVVFSKLTKSGPTNYLELRGMRLLLELTPEEIDEIQVIYCFFIYVCLFFPNSVCHIKTANGPLVGPGP